MSFVQVGIGKANELLLILTKITARQADNFMVFDQAFDYIACRGVERVLDIGEIGAGADQAIA